MRNEIKARIEILENYIETNTNLIKREQRRIANAENAKEIQECVNRVEKYVNENNTYKYTIKVLKLILAK